MCTGLRRVTAAPTSALSNEPSLGPRGAACEAAPNAALRTAGCGTGRALSLQVQLGAKERTRCLPRGFAGQSAVRCQSDREFCRFLQRQFCKCSHLYSPHKTRNAYRVTQSPVLTPRGHKQGLVAFNWPCFVTMTCVARRQPPAIAGGSRRKG